MSAHRQHRLCLYRVLSASTKLALLSCTPFSSSEPLLGHGATFRRKAARPSGQLFSDLINGRSWRASAAGLGCAERTGIRIGIWGGVVRNFVLDDRALFDGEQSLHLFDFIDPFSDIDCVVDRADDWPLVLQSISSSVAFAGFVRWEVQTRAEALSRADRYQSVGAESFIVWHKLDEKGHSRISLDPVRGQVDALLETPARRTGHGKAIGDDVWQDLLDSLRMARYSFEFPQEPYAEHETSHPDRGRLETLAEDSRGAGSSNRKHAALRNRDARSAIDRSPPPPGDRLPALPHRDHPLRAGKAIENSAVDSCSGGGHRFFYLGGLLYRQRNSPGIRLRLRMREEENLSRGGFRSIVPWTSLWSLTPGEDCCRHEDFRNGVAVASWRALNPNVTYTQAQAQEFAPVAQVIANTPYEEPPVVANLARGKLVPIPESFVSVPPSPCVSITPILRIFWDETCAPRSASRIRRPFNEGGPVRIRYRTLAALGRSAELSISSTALRAIQPA